MHPIPHFHAGCDYNFPAKMSWAKMNRCARWKRTVGGAVWPYPSNVGLSGFVPRDLRTETVYLSIPGDVISAE